MARQVWKQGYLDDASMKEKEVEKASLKYVHCGKAEGRDFE
jgi:hypothetical protein